MPEYLSPGVYIEETSFRTRSIQGVSTSTAGFIGPARSGPLTGEPELLTSFADFARIYGGFGDLAFSDGPRPNYLAHAVRAFFEEGGQRLYVMRVFNPGGGDDPFGFTPTGADDPIPQGIPRDHYGIATRRNDETDDPDPLLVILVARFPGAAGNMRVRLTLSVGPNIVQAGANPTLSRVRNFDVVLARTIDRTTTPATIAFASGDGLMVALRDPTSGIWTLTDTVSDTDLVIEAGISPNLDVRVVTIRVEVERPGTEPQSFAPREFIGDFSPDARSNNGLTRTFTPNPTNRFAALTTPFAFDGVRNAAGDDLLATPALLDQVGLHLVRSLFRGLLGTLDDSESPTLEAEFTLAGGSDGALPTGTPHYSGIPTGLRDYVNDRLQAEKNGLLAFEDVENISIIAGPGYSDFGDEDAAFAIQTELINHCESMQYRVAVLDTPPNYLVGQALNFRNRRSSNFAAMYYPWIRVSDTIRPGQTLLVPPSGHVAGMYARNDSEDAVFKAPANMVVRTALDFELRLNKAHQDVLNPQGVNAFRFFEGRGLLLWGARTISDDSDWTYISVRRYFAYLEYSIDRGTQWVVFENNGPELWGNVRRTVENFLFNEWRAGGLLGDKPENAYFVVCDRTTMTQQDLDQGRLICLVGVAPVKPAEFVIFRIGQWTAESSR